MFYLSADFQNVCCIFYDKYLHEIILPPAKEIKHIRENSILKP